jgi:hypothetical protein
MSEIIYDTIILELQKDGKPVASAKITTTDVKQLLESHNLTIGDILQDVIDSFIKNGKQSPATPGTGSVQLSLFD